MCRMLGTDRERERERERESEHVPYVRHRQRESASMCHMLGTDRERERERACAIC